MQDNYWLQKAESLVWASIGKTAPNPSVAAIIVKNNRVIASGVHMKAGLPHAEQLALANCDASGATMYITLEPCNHLGKTPSCALAIIRSGIKKVVYGCKDINPKVSGSGAEFLIANGVECINLNSEFCSTLYEAFFCWAQAGVASVTLKAAVDQSMHMADNNGNRIAITSDQMNRRTAHWRAFHDAILTTDQTVLRDNPQMNARLPTGIEKKALIILAKNNVFNSKQNVFTNCKDISIFLPEGINPVPDVDANFYYYSGKYICWTDLLAKLAGLGLHRVWVEAGPSTTKYLIENKIAQDILLLQGSQQFEESCYNLKNLGLPDYPIRNLYCTKENEKIFHIGNTKFPELFLDKERLCLAE